MAGKQTIYLESDEYYPVFELKSEDCGEGYIVLTGEEIMDYERVCNEWDNWQERLKNERHFEEGKK